MTTVGLSGRRTHARQPDDQWPGDRLPTPLALSFDHVGLTYPDGTPALADIDLEVRRGELVSVVGPSGCGKSTLLRIASGLLEATTGAVDVDRDRLGYVFQDPTLLPWRTVADNVGLLAELRGVDRARRSQMVADAIALVGLVGFEHHHPRSLSGGMKMRASLARSLTLEPEVFLFDEPFGALDELTREHLNDELLRLFVAERFAGLFVTHSVQEAVFLSTRVAVMSPRPGRIVTEIDVDFDYPRPPELRFDPAFTRIAGRVSGALRRGEG
jgi:NitT/TauT family transport system ATP-binding protein